jgi:hypothetical protein
MTSQVSEQDAAAPALGLQSVADYGHQLSCRTQLPSERLSEFLGWSENEIREEARAVTRVLKRFAEAVVRSMDSPEGLDDFLGALDLKIISRDHDWRGIFAAIRDYHDNESAEFKRTTLIKYLQYLSFRKRLLDYICSRRTGLATTGEMSAPLGAGGRDAAAQGDLVGDLPGFERMPMGESVPVHLGNEEVLELVLGRNLFELVGGPHPYVVDENGVTCFVREGRNVIGRHPESDLSVDANFGNVSRAHMILDWDGGRGFTLMDLSSRGSWMRAELLRAALRTLGPAIA